MALELNKKKYLVLCLMLILFNHHIHGAIGADAQDPKKGSKTDEPRTPESGSKAVAPENGSKFPSSQVSNSGSNTLESQVSKSGSKTAEPPENESKFPASQISNSKSGSKINEPGSKAVAPENGSNSRESQISNTKSGSKTGKPRSKAEAPENGSKIAEPPENGSKSSASQISNNKSGSKTDESGSKTEAHENGSNSRDSQISNTKSGSKTAKPGSKAEAPENASKAPLSQVSNSGSKIPESQVPKNGIKGAEPQINNINAKKPLIGIGPKIAGIGTKGGQPQVPCYFIFGDSLVDAGNNNNLKTLARSDYDPYGIDFKPLGATGRFSNGKTTVDIMAELLGFDHYIPPSEQTNGTDMLQGLNFASAASGIREETAQHLGDRITMKEQVDNFKAKVGEMAGLLGGQKNTTDYLGKCLFSVGLGSNDYLNNYFLPSLYPTSRLLTPEQYADDLIKQYTTHLMTIYDLGARKFVLNGVSQVGCTPNALAQGSPDGTCVKNINDANEMFNTRLKSLVDNLNREHPDAKFTYINSYGLFQELKDKASTYGFKVTTDGCCGIGKNNGLITCLPGLIPCQNRNEYIFWDAYHPTEATNIIGARRTYIRQIPSDAYPYDVKTLITL